MAHSAWSMKYVEDNLAQAQALAVVVSQQGRSVPSSGDRLWEEVRLDQKRALPGAGPRPLAGWSGGPIRRYDGSTGRRRCSCSCSAC